LKIEYGLFMLKIISVNVVNWSTYVILIVAVRFFETHYRSV